MKKKKITSKDLELYIEVAASGQSVPLFTETRTCPETRNNCTDATFDKPQLCDTTTTSPTEQNCVSANVEECRPTIKCPLTMEPACETKVGCVDSASHAQLCCPYTNQKACQNSVNNCISSECVDSVRICQVTRGYPCVGSLDKCAQLTDLDTCER